MAVIFLTGFESAAEKVDNITLTGTAAYSTTQARTGTRSIRCNPASAASGYFSFSVPSAPYWAGFGLYIATLPSLTRIIGGSVAANNLRLTSTGTLQIYDRTTLAATTSAALNTGQWYWVSFILGGAPIYYDNVIEVDGVATANGAVGLQGQSAGTVLLGASGTESSAMDIYIDDVIIAEFTTSLAPSKVALLLPISDKYRDTLWTGGSGGTTNLYDAVNNCPPVGSATESDTTQIEHAGGAGGATDKYEAYMTTWADAGINEADTTIAARSVVVWGEDSATGAKLLSYGSYYSTEALTVGELSIDVSTGHGSGALGTYSTGTDYWNERRDAIASPVPAGAYDYQPYMRVTRPETASRVASVCFMGIYVAWTPARTNSGYAQSNAKIKGIAVQAYGQSLAQIKVLANKSYAQAQATIAAGAVTTYKSYAQSNTKIKAINVQSYGLAAALIYSTPQYSSVYDSFTRTVADGWGTSDNAGGWTMSDSAVGVFSTNGSSAQVANYGERISLGNLVLPQQWKIYYEFSLNVLPNAADSLYIALQSGRGSSYIGAISSGWSQEGTGLIIDENGNLSIRSYHRTFNTTASLGATYSAGQTWAYESYVSRSGNDIVSNVTVWNLSTPNTKYNASVTRINSIAYVPGHASFLFTSGTATLIATLDNLLLSKWYSTPSAQAQSQIKTTYRSYAQAQAKIITTKQSYAQSLAHIRLTNQVWAQSNAYIKAIGITAYGQSLAQIKQTYPFGGGGAILAQDDFSPDYANLNGNPADIGGNYSVYYNDSSGTVLRSLSGHLRNSASGAGRSYYRVGTGTDGDTDHLLTWDITANGYGGLWLRGTGGNNFYCLDFGYRAEVDSTLYRRTAGVLTVLASYNIDPLAGTDTRVRISVSGVSSTSLKVRYWDQSGAEPETWAINTTDNTAGNQIAAGAFGIWGRLDTSADYSADDYLVTEIGSGVQGPTFAQAQTQVSIPIIVTVRVYAQAQTQVKATTLSYAQTQGQIKTTYRVYAQSQAQIEQIYLAYAQATAKIILSNLRVYGQAQVQIKTAYQVYAQAQSKIILSGLLAYAQAQGRVKAVYQVYAQAQTWVEQSYQGYAQVATWIEQTYRGYAQALANIKQTYQAYGQTNVKIILSGIIVYAQALARIKSIYQGYGQAQTWVEQSYQVWAQASAKIVLSNLQAYGQAQADIKTTYRIYGQANSYIKIVGINGYAQAQSQVKQVYRSYAQSQVTIKVTTLVYAQAQSKIIQTYQIYGQAQAKINAFNIQQYAQASVWLEGSFSQYAQAQVWIKTSYQSYGQAQTQIKQIYRVYAQSLAQIKTTYLVNAQANTYIKTTGLQVYAQSQAQIKQTYTGWAQANAYIRLSGLQVYGQAQVRIKTTYQVYGQAQAKLNAFNIQTYAQAMVWLEGAFTQFAQSQAKLNAFAVKAYGQSQVWVKASYATFAQAQTQIKSTYLSCAQSQAQIKSAYQVYGQSQAQIKTTYQAYAQAQSKIILSALQVYGQAQTQVKTSYVVYAQANARIIMIGLSVYAQTQTQIKATYQVFAQANTYVKVTGNVTFAQAQTQIKTTYLVYAQAQGVILASYRGYAQAQSYIAVRDIEAYAQAGATIRAIGQGYSQAEVWIYIPQIARPIADISNDGNWVGTVRD